MADLLVNLYALEETKSGIEKLQQEDIHITRALSPDKSKIIAFVKKYFTQAWANECEAAFANNPPTCYVAVHANEIIGFACYDATAKNFFGPTGMHKKFSGMGIGKALLYKCLLSMKENGYAYAIIGWGEGAAGFYQKAVNAVIIEGSEKANIYSRLIDKKN